MSRKLAHLVRAFGALAWALLRTGARRACAWAVPRRRRLALLSLRHDGRPPAAARHVADRPTWADDQAERLPSLIDEAVRRTGAWFPGDLL